MPQLIKAQLGDQITLRDPAGNLIADIEIDRTRKRSVTLRVSPAVKPSDLSPVCNVEHITLDQRSALERLPHLSHVSKATIEAAVAFNVAMRNGEDQAFQTKLAAAFLDSVARDQRAVVENVKLADQTDHASETANNPAGVAPCDREGKALERGDVCLLINPVPSQGTQRRVVVSAILDGERLTVRDLLAGPPIAVRPKDLVLYNDKTARPL